MATLAPRLIGDLTEWFDTEFPFAGLRMAPFRVEDFMTDGDYVVRAELPGVDPEKDISVLVERGLLDIRAERHESAHDDAEGRYRTEFRYGSLHRTIRLPEGADEKKIKARYEKGILEVVVPVHMPGHDISRTIPIEKKS
ncbi:MAG TPA: Hsp20/alpha crystallin family protein [Micromonosporaceae bacterium]